MSIYKHANLSSLINWNSYFCSPKLTSIMFLKSLFSLLLLTSISFLSAQDSDPVLFSVEGVPVHVSEFDYIYNKNNGDGANYSKNSLQEYLDLYTKFKLKVQRAKEIKLDTVKSLQKELRGYRKQLADSYLVDKEVSAKLTDEAFKRMQTDRNIAHIFIPLPEKAGELVTSQAQEKINNAYKFLQEGATWKHVVETVSEDKNSRDKNGNIGFFTAMLPSGFYSFENAIYNTPIGKYSEPFRTTVGYHIIKVLEERPARGEIEVAHIFLRKNKKLENKNIAAKSKIDSIYNLLQADHDFEALAKEHSEDKNTASNGGYLGWFGLKRYDVSFENTAFNLPRNGDISKPLETSAGFHIVKRINKRDFSDLARIKGKISKQLKNDDRSKLAKTSLVNDIKEKSNFKENAAALNKFTNSLDESFYSLKWEPNNIPDESLFSFDDNFSSGTKDFVEYCKGSLRKRLAFKKDKAFEESVGELYQEFVEQKAIEYEETNLENKYPEFKSLMREYEEGILLFEITKQEVWDKASQDSIGLISFFEQNKDNYVWAERAKIMEFELKSEDKELLKSVKKAAKKGSRENLLGTFNTPESQMLNIRERTIEKSEDFKNSFKWKKGHISDGKVENGKTTFLKVVDILPAAPKKLDEARGYIIADYQDKLEKDWIDFLKNRYKVVVDQNVFNSLIK